jgi:adenylate kinase
MMNLIFLGPPGAGKGTQSQFICNRYKIPQISTGDMLREARRHQTELGKKAEAFMNAGQLVPDEVVIGIVNERISKDDCQNGFLLDGFPRTVAQAEALENSLAKHRQKIDAVLNLVVDEEDLIRRLNGRRVCKSCGAAYHIDFAPSKKPGICDRDNGELYQRGDDTETAIKERLEVYKNQTKPLTGYYQSKGVLKTVDGVGSVDDISRRIEESLESLT